jgi:hypothetical protein
VDASEHTTLSLYSKGKNADEMNIPLFDRNGKSFYIKCLLDSKNAGICMTLYAEQCIISFTDQKLQFFYNNQEHSFAEIGEHKGRD